MKMRNLLCFYYFYTENVWLWRSVFFIIVFLSLIWLSFNFFILFFRRCLSSGEISLGRLASYSIFQMTGLLNHDFVWRFWIDRCFFIHRCSPCFRDRQTSSSAYQTRYFKPSSSGQRGAEHLENILHDLFSIGLCHSFKAMPRTVPSPWYQT